MKKRSFRFEKYGIVREQVYTSMFFTVNDATEDAETREIERNFRRLKVIFPGHPSIVLLPAITSGLFRSWVRVTVSYLYRRRNSRRFVIYGEFSRI